MEQTQGESDARPATLRAAVAMLYAQATGLGGLTAWMLWLSLTREQTSPGAGLAEAAGLAGVAVLLYFAGRKLGRGSAVLRGAAIFVQLLLLPIGYFLTQEGWWPFAAAAWAVGVVTIWLLMAPSTRQALGVS